MAEHGPTGRARRRRAAGDDGITLVELLVAMALMGVFLSMFTAAVVQVYGTVHRTEAIADAQSQVTLAMNRLDREIRYATEISQPATAGDPTVEWLTTNTGAPTCSQLRFDVDRQLLQLRTWRQGEVPQRWDTWPPLVGHIAAAEFTLPDEEGVQLHRLTVRLTATAGGAAADATKETVVTFTAQNSTNNEETTACGEGRGYQ